MDLVERYVHAVGFWLPRAEHDDIVAELSEDIQSQIEEQEGKLGRKLNESEIEALLKQRGRPVLVASRYRPQQYLIGPALFPVYRFVMILVALCYLVPWVLTWIALAVFDPHYHTDLGRTFGPLWGTFWVTTFVALGTVTLVFAIIERVQPRILEDWNPRTLPPVRDPNRIPRLNSTIEIAANVAFAAWWTTNMWSTTVFDRNGVRIVFAPVWKDFLWAFLLLAVANILLAAVNLARPYWTWLRAYLQLLLSCAAAIAFCALSKANLLEQIVVPNLDPARAAHIVNASNANASRAFPLVVAGCVLAVVLSSIGRLFRLRASRGKLVHSMAVILLVAGLGAHVRVEAQALPAGSLQLPSQVEVHGGYGRCRAAYECDVHDGLTTRRSVWPPALTTYSCCGRYSRAWHTCR